MSVMQEYLKKYGNSTVSTPRMTAPVSSAGAGNGTMSEYLKWLEEEEERKRLQQAMNRTTLSIGNDDDEDIAPTEDDSLLDFFQKGSFSDGFDWHDIPTAILGTAGDAALNVAKGALGIVEGVADLGVYGVAGVADALGHDEYAEGARRRASENLIDKVTGGAEDYLNKYSVLGRTADSAMQGVGQMLTNVLLGGAGQAAGLGKVGLTALTSAVTGVSGVGHGMSEAYQGGATDEEATTYGLISGAADALTEWMFDGMGQAVNALGYNRGLFSADDLLAKKASSMFSRQIAKNMVEFGIKSSAEGLEEVVAGIAQGIGKKLTYMSEESIWDILRDENLLEQFVTGAVSSGFAQSGVVPGMKQGSLIESNQTGRDFVTGYTQTEQTIIDKAVENRIKAREENGQTVTHKDKTEIESEVKRLLDKGYLDADEIESILGGEEYTSVKNELSNFFASDDYKAYKQAEKAEADARAEFDPLVKMKQGEMTGEQIYRRDELKKILDESKVGELKSKVAPEATRIAQLRNKMRGNVQSMVQGTRMAESYNELARKQQKFQVDVSQYTDENAKKTVQSILDSCLGDNSNQFHETVDFLAKLSADKGVVFDLTNNEKLKGTEHYKEGYWTHGFVSDDGNIVLNYDSPRALNTTVGHEITHVLEKAGVYKELSSAVRNYAISKEGLDKYNARIKEAEGIYGGMKNTTAEGEVTADIIGEYLFTDYEFISNLSTSNRNVFQKIYDEIKYMVKIATAGSNEARELLKAKKMFDKAYRENVKGKPVAENATTAEDTDVQHSLSIEYVDGTVEELADLRNLTDEQSIQYLESAQAFELLDETYIPVRKELPQVIIDSLAQIDVHLENRSLIMEVEKARRLMRKGINQTGKKRGHGLSPRQVIDIINDIENPIKLIYQTNRVDLGGNPIPNNVAIFVQYSKNGVNGFATVEFENPERTEVIGTEFGETDFYTVNTAFFPNTTKNGKPYNYMKQLEDNPDNIVVEIKRRQSEDNANWEKLPSTTDESPSIDATVAQEEPIVNTELITEEQNEQGLDRVSETQYSLSKDTEFSQNAIKKNQEKLLVDAEAMTAAKELRERIASRMTEIKDRGLVALPEDMEGNTYIANSSYDGTEENTTICPRSLASEAFVDAVSEYLGRPLTVEEQIYISQDLQGRSLTPECTYCYVATDRKAYRAFLGEYINQRDAVIEKIKANPNADVSKSGDLYREFLNGRKDTKPMYNRFKMWVDAYQNGTPMVEASHLANISKLMGDIKEFGEDLKPQIVDAMKYAQSASWAKKRVSYVAYNGHILKWKDDRIKKLNSHYGLRMYSFSDFHPAFVLENMQMITDASVRGLKMLGYTKDTDFVEIFAPSGMNINISTFGFETDGNVYENNIIGAEWAKAQELRSQYPNVGITFVATNDTLVEWALDQDWIDVVIPYHLVRTGAEVAKAFGYTNYTSESSDTKTSEWKKGDKKSIAPTEHNNDFQTYMDALAKNHLNPRFERFKDNPNYMKLVNECRQSASQSKPVQPVFNEDAAMVALAKLEANGYYQPIGGSVDRMYEIASEVAEDMTKNIAPTKYSMSKATDFPNDAEDIAKQYFGTTEKWSETGWLLRDGTQLDFSGRHWERDPENEIDLGESYYSGKRNMEHYEIAEAFPELREYSRMEYRGEHLDRFQNRGNIRIVGKGIVGIEKMPTEEQFEKLRSYFGENIDRTIVVGIGRDGLTYKEGTKPSVIIEGIRDYFSHNRKYQSELMRFHTQYSMSKATDNEGNQLTREQEEFFKDSKLRDENGKLIPMYHGTNSPDFTVFDPQFSDDKLSLFFTSDPEVANTYTLAQDYGRDVDPYNLITKNSSAEQFNKAQERAGGGLRVVEVTRDWIAEMKQKARHAKQDYILQVYELVADIEKASRGDVAPVFDSYLNSIREELASGNVHGSNLGHAINKLQSSLTFLKNRKLERNLSMKLYDTKNTLDKVRAYEDAVVGEEYIGQYVYTETNSMVPFVARGKTDSYFTHIIPGTESELVEKALDRMKWVKEHNLGNRYKVYLNLTNPYIIDTGTDYSGMMDAVSIKKGYGGTGWEVEMENAEDDLVKYMTTEEFDSFLDSAFDAETTAKIKSQIEADNEAYRKEWDDLDPEYVEHDIQLENVNIRYVEPGKWSSLKFNGMEDAKTRDVAKWAKENGYDGVIFKNMRDSGGYAAYRGRGASTVAVAFDSNKVKSVDNVKPTADPDIRYSMSKEGAKQSIHGDYHVYGSDFGVNDPLADFAPVADTAPVSGTAENASIQPKMQLTDEKDAAPVADGIQIRTVKERLNAKLNNRQTELANIEKHRADSLKSLDEKIAKAQATLDGKKNKDTKVANTLKKRIERLQRLKADIDAGYAKRINDIKKSIDKTSVELEKDHTERDRYERAVARINAMLKHETEALNAEYAQKKADLQSRLANKDSYISNTARELYDELRGLRKGVRASEKLASLLDGGFDWGNLRSALSNVRYTPNQTVNPNSVAERAVRQLLNESYESDMESINDLDVELAEKVHQLEVKAEEDRKNARTANQRKLKMEEHSQFWSDLIGNTSTWKDLPWGLAYKTRTLRRILRKVVRDANGNVDIAKADAIYDALETKYDHNEALLKKESQRLKEVFFKLKLTHEEDAYAQMLGELRHNPDTTLTEDVVRDYYNQHKGKIDTNKVDRAIAETRRTYDELFDRLNAALREQGMKEIPYRQGYFPHFTNPKQNWFEKLMNWKHIDTEIPTSIAGLTDQFKPQRSWQSFNKQRMGDKTDYSLYQGLDTYIHGALDWIYHIDDLQSRRALENHLRYTHSDEGIKARIEEIKANDTYDADEAQKMIDGVLAEANNPLGGLVRELMNRTNTLANKKSSMDRGMEDFTNRKIYSTLTNLNNRITANQVVGSLSSALTNFIPMVQSWHQVSPFYTVRGLGDMIRSTVQDDGLVAKSDFLTNRLVEEEKLYKTGWDKVTDKAAFMMNVVDNITSQTVWRSKYLQNLHEGMSEAQAIRDADQFAKNLMAGRSRGNAPTIFDAKNPIVKIFTAFQLEVSNQYGYMFEDVPQDTESKARLVKGYATAFLGAYMYNALYSSLVGRDAAFDPISIIEDLLKDLFGDDEEEPEEIIMNLADNILEEVPYIGGLLGGGRIPMSSALPYGTDSTPFESMLTDVSEGNWKSLGKQMLKPLYYLAMPVAGGQIKKTAEGLGMFLGDHPITGSYTDSGKLRFPVEATFGNVLQAGLFGQYASQNAREYFDEERSPLGENQIEEFMESGLPIHDYWEYREGLSGLSKLDEKADYIAGLDLPIDTKNLFINNIADRSEDIDLTGYNAFGDFEEFDFAVKYPEKYEIAQAVGGYEAYMTYQEGMKDMKLAEKVDYVAGLNLTIEQKNALINGETDRKEPIDLTGYENFSSFAEFEYAQNNPESYAVAQAVGGYDDFMVYKDELGDIHADRDEYGQSISGSRKEKVWAYIYSLDIPEIQQHILFKMEYNSDDEHNEEIIEYLNRRKDISAEEMTAILLQLGFLVDSEGNIYW